jgi:prophage regulatory protein
MNLLAQQKPTFVCPTTDRLLRINEVMHLANVSSRTTLWHWEKAGLFPPRRKVGRKSIRWLQSEVIVWLNDRQGK